ncbi:acetate kinase [Acididesulfobacillus acetoxydans]|uniref:Acetate kinase n=1 Tax=Acididesulfobacillus acetoxydans TaxID=1561005 RepID=A0A8S0Y446_9FIRM|nr:acetate kinase [Acididesulfobacillus acetoxydans]CAA7602735.1 acetate kinase [Acididesulfobacillus acetoxydans]CEJ06408.1 Acetate kinase [Acididesulfobacillus acetoxydans]
MYILVINCGSSSLKYQLLDTVTRNPLAKGLVERIGMSGSGLTHRPAGKDAKAAVLEIPDHTVAIRLVLDTLVDPTYGVMQNLGQIGAVGHRVVHGGEEFAQSALVTAEVMKGIEDCVELAPLHNPPNIAGIKACQKLMPGVPQVAVFDTAFHQTMPREAYIYGLPYEMYEKYKIRRYGFHGTSHKYVSQRAAVLLQKPLASLKLISCHLGNGSSITAVRGGKSVETSMGFTPLEGLMMGTRSGNLDPAIVSYIMRKENMDFEQINDFLNKRSGVLGVSGVSSDFRDIEAAAQQGNGRAQLALDIFAHDVKEYIGAYAAILDGVDAIIFTAGLGENSAGMREAVCGGLSYMGVAVDPEKNKVRGEEVDISAEGTRCPILVIPTNEELMIALETEEVVRGL